MIELGYNYRLTDFQSALGITQLEKNKNGVVRRNEISLAYKKVFEGKIKFQDLPEGTYNAHHLFIIELERRKELYDFLKSKGILAQIHYIPVHTLPYYKKLDMKGLICITLKSIILIVSVYQCFQHFQKKSKAI